MRDVVVPFDPSWGELVDVDLVDASAWVALFRKDDHLTVRTPRDECAVPDDLQFPLIRVLDDERVVVVDTWMQGDRPNALVVSTTNSTIASTTARVVPLAIRAALLERRIRRVEDRSILPRARGSSDSRRSRARATRPMHGR